MPVSFSIRVGDELRVAGAEPLNFQGKSYIPINSLILQMGGGCRINPDRIQLDLAALSAWLRINEVAVSASLGDFSLAAPIVTRGNDVLMAVEDVAPFLERAFRVSARQDAPSEPVSQPDKSRPENVPEPSPLAPLEPAGKTDEIAAALTPPPVPEEQSAKPANPPAQSRNLERPIEMIVIDPGHGGPDNGCETDSVAEDAIVLRIAEQFKSALEQGGRFKVVLTRDKDQPLSQNERINAANSNKGDLYVSLHIAASLSPSAKGPRVYYLARADSEDVLNPRALPPTGGSYTDRSGQIAALFAQQLAGQGADLAVVRQIPNRVMQGVAMPAVLVELGFITNPEDERNLQTESWQKDVAKAMVEAVKAYTSAGDGGSAQ